MGDLSVFFAQNAAVESTQPFIVSDRFKDAEGQAVAWELRSMTEAENEECRKSSTRKVKGKNGVFVPETNTDEYLAKLVVSSIQFPNLKDADLQKSYGTLGAENLLRKMLLPGEYASLVQRVQEINGFNQSLNELAEEVKN
ncbi:phage tail assembly chaperone [Paenibacillus luteus]|uniref:phage tail assembly chaperone n=1 Tax=Paenibacillus luteus TaxID=2545753 RepID=UPI0011419CB9|nr:phage portal protein [Paenibacillus luteus]